MADSIELPSEDLPPMAYGATIKQTDEMPVKYAQDFVRVYGSQVAVSSTIWDISFSIGQPIADHPNDIHMEQRVLVTMSWQAAKALAHILLQRVNAYEHQYGELRLTPLSQQEDQPSIE